jgi:hypothetical protein
MVVGRIARWWRESREFHREHESAWSGHRLPLNGGLSLFQQECESRLVDALGKQGFTLVDRELRGVTERYVQARIDGTDLTVWIYLDGAEVSSPSGAVARLERWDAKTPGDLINELIRQTVLAVERLGAGAKGPG